MEGTSSSIEWTCLPPSSAQLELWSLNRPVCCKNVASRRAESSKKATVRSKVCSYRKRGEFLERINSKLRVARRRVSSFELTSFPSSTTASPRPSHPSSLSPSPSISPPSASSAAILGLSALTTSDPRRTQPKQEKKKQDASRDHHHPGSSPSFCSFLLHEEEADEKDILPLSRLGNVVTRVSELGRLKEERKEEKEKSST